MMSIKRRGYRSPWNEVLKAVATILISLWGGYMVTMKNDNRYFYEQNKVCLAFN